jgi:hypothetical protein
MAGPVLGVATNALASVTDWASRTTAREVTCDFLVGDNTYGSTAEWLEAYFTEFALLARRGR